MTSCDSTGSGGIVPDHLDVSRALAATLATHRGQFDVLGVLAAECASPRDVDRFVLAVLSSFAGFVARKVEDPESYLLQWIALEQELAAAEDEARDDTDDDRDTDVN
jgi:hypothetical protein